MRRLMLVLIVALLPALAQAETVIPTGRAQISLSFAPVVRKAAPAVVNIYTRKVVAERISPFANDPLFSELFGGQVVPRVRNALGSGVIVTPDGLVVSNYHVAGDADQIRVVLNDGRQFDATVILADQQTDIAILRLAGAQDLPTLPIGHTDDVEVGDLVLAIGNPFGIGQTVSSGIVSGLARTGMIADNPRGYFVQTDAAINPGNSGGALVDLSGRMVGINTAILSRSGGSIGIGFAIPADLVAQVLKQALAGETHFRKPWAGMKGQPVDADLAAALGLERPTGVVVSALHPASPFAAAGLRAGDVITAIDGHPVNAPAGLLYRMMVLGPGATADVTYQRAGRTYHVSVPMIDPPDFPARNARVIDENVPLNGLHVSTINPAVIVEQNLPMTAEGVVVTDAEGYAARLGFRPGDIILSINGMPIQTTADVVRASRSQVRKWRVTLMRDGQEFILTFRV